MGTVNKAPMVSAPANEVVPPPVPPQKPKWLTTLGLFTILIVVIFSSAIIITVKKYSSPPGKVNRVSKVISTTPTGISKTHLYPSPTKIPAPILKSSPIAFGKYTINLPSGWGWTKVGKDYFSSQDSWSECEDNNDQVPNCLIARVRDVNYNKSDFEPEILVADRHDNYIDNGISQTCGQKVRLGSPGFTANYDISWGCFEGKANPEVFYSIQGCPRKDLCISYQHICSGPEECNEWNLEKIKSFVNEIEIIE